MKGDIRQEKTQNVDQYVFHLKIEPECSYLIVILPRLLVDEVLPALLGVCHLDRGGVGVVVGEGRGRR